MPSNDNRNQSPAPALAQSSLQELVEALASDRPTPGGGAAAAIAGSMAAALVAMLCRVTRGKRGYEEAEARRSQIEEQALALRGSLLTLGDRDAAAYEAVVAAMRLPRTTPEEQEVRRQRIEEALWGAARVPLEGAEKSLQVLQLAAELIPIANRNAASDGATASHLAAAALEATLLNVETNLNALRQGGDEAQRLRTRCGELREAAARALDRAVRAAREAMGS